MRHEPPKLTSPNWSPRTKFTVTLVIFLSAMLLLLRLSDLIPVVSVAVILAYLLTPLVNFIEKRVLIFPPFAGKPHRNAAVLTTYVVIFAVVFIVILVVVPALTSQIEEFGRRIPSIIRALEGELERILSEPLVFNGEPISIGGEVFIPLERLRQVFGMQHLTDVIQLQGLNIFDNTQDFVGSLTGSAFNVVGGAVNVMINLTFLLSMMFFLMRDGSIFARRTIQLMPEQYRGDAQRLLYELGLVWNAYLRGQVTLALLMGTAAFIAATIVGLPNPIILGLTSGLLEFIPSIGSGLALFPAALLALVSKSATIPGLEGGTFMVVVIFIWAILQNIEAIFLVPRVMGGSLNLHPLAVIVGVLAGASLAGGLGIVLSAPTVASLRVFGQYIYGKLLDKNPFTVEHVRRRTPRILVLVRHIRAQWHSDPRIAPVRERLGMLRGWHVRRSTN